MKNIYIITGGTLVHVSPHFSLCAPAYGKVGEEIHSNLNEIHNSSETNIYLIKTKMAGISDDETKEKLASIGYKGDIETNEDIRKLTKAIASDNATVGIVMSAAICDFEPDKLAIKDSHEIITKFGKSQKRLHKAESVSLDLVAAPKVIDTIKSINPDIKLVTFKTTAGESEVEILTKGSFNLARSSSDYVFCNDIHTKQNLVVSSCGAVFRATSRSEALNILCSKLISAIS